MGGALAIQAAAAMPELVERLVLIAPAGLPID
jgi:pimeloyl-ACP methyl ester carboxylesterase